MTTKPPCPVCVAEVDEVHWEGGFEVHDSYARGGLGGTAIGTWEQVKWAATPSADMKPAPAFDVITLQPCGHELRYDAMSDYRERMKEMQRS